jgi:CHAT domain-containing protein
MDYSSNIYIDASHNGEKLIIGLRHQHDTVWNYEEVIVSMPYIEERCQELIHQINISSRTGDQQQLMSSLISMGSQLCDMMIPSHLKEKLRNTKGDHLFLTIDEHLVHIPWELLCVGEQFLCEQFSMGRSVKIKQKISISNDRKINAPVRLWIVCAPHKDLEKTGWEGNEICYQMDKINMEQGLSIVASLDIEKTCQEIKNNIKSYDFVHYAGHGKYDCLQPGKSGWRLIDGTFTADDIDSIAGGMPMPALVFSNACQSARTEQWHNQHHMDYDSFGLVNSFIRSGVKHFIGPFWEIPDEPASEFSILVYRFLTNGNTIGQAIKLARKSMKQTNPSDASFASYVLYGDPSIQYFKNTDQPDSCTEKSTKNKKPAIRSILSNQQSTAADANPPKQNTYSSRMWPIIVIIMLLIFGKYVFYSHQETNQSLSPDQIYAFMKLEKAKDDEIDRLIHEINSKMNAQSIEFEEVSKDQWTSMPLRIAIVVGDSLRSFVNQGLDEMVASAVENELMDCSRIRVLDRTALETIIREYRLILSQLVDQKQKIRPSLLPVDLFLDIRINILVSGSKKKYNVVMRLKKTRTSEIIFKQEIPIDISDFIYHQKIASNLIAFIRKKYPIRARVVHKTNQSVSLNVGLDMGVHLQMSFCLDKSSDIEIRINEVFKEKSNGMLIAGKNLPGFGTKMVQCSPQP